MHVTSNINPDFKPFIPTYNEKDYVTILKPSGDGKETIIRLQLLSEKSEKVKLSFTAGNPNSLTICIVNEETGESITDTVTLLPYVMRTLKMESAEYCKIKKENMLLNILMPAKVCFLKTKN